VNDALVWIGSNMCLLLHKIGAVQSSFACDDPRGMAVFGGAVLLLGGISAVMLSVMGRGIDPN
jgi:hypothetical protein